MLTLSVMLNLLVSFGLIAMGIKYIRATPPLDYHAEITQAETLGEETLRVLGALYGVMGGSFLSLGVTLVPFTLFGVWSDLFWVKFTILAAAVLAGSFATIIPREVEQVTGVRTPWRIAGALTSLAGVAFVISIL